MRFVGGILTMIVLVWLMARAPGVSDLPAWQLVGLILAACIGPMWLAAPDRRDQ